MTQPNHLTKIYKILSFERIITTDDLPLETASMTIGNVNDMLIKATEVSRHLVQADRAMSCTSPSELDRDTAVLLNTVSFLLDQTMDALMTLRRNLDERKGKWQNDTQAMTV